MENEENSKRVYRSKVMLAHDSDKNDCAICRFINGSRAMDDVLAVVSLLDSELAEANQDQDTLRRLLEEIGKIRILGKMEKKIEALENEVRNAANKMNEAN